MATRMTTALERDRQVQRRVLAATSISYIVVVLDTTIVNVALERISQSLVTDTAGLQWVVNAYTLAFASLLLTAGTLGDRLGARKVYLAGLAVFTLASGLCGFAPDLTTLSIARVLQGVGAAMLAPCSLTLLNNAYPDPGERASAIGVWASCGGAALAAGPVAGGVLIDLLGWRSIFLVNLPIGLLGIWMTLRIADSERPAHRRHLDLSGQFAAIVALAASVTVLVEGGKLGWASPAILGGIAVALVAWVAFLRIEMRHTEPMLPLSFFRNSAFSGATVAVATTAMTNYGVIFMLSLYFQQVRGYSPLETGLAFLPLTAVVTAANMASGRWARASGPRRPVMVGLTITTLAFLGMVVAIPAAQYWQVGIPMLAIGVGAGLTIPAATAALMGTVARDRVGIAAGVLNSGRQTGSALGVAIFGALIAAIHPFNSGMRVALCVAVIFSIVALACWLLGKRDRAAA